MTLQVRLKHQLRGFALDVDFEAPQGLTVLFGRSGSGKTTIINAVAGLMQPDAGRISVDGRVLCDSTQGVRLPPHRRRLGYIFQEARLFPHLTVGQNLLYGQFFALKKRTRLPDVVDMLGIGALLDRRPGALSGGEKQRVAIGRALLAEPEMLLADEPLAALDEARKTEILPYFERLRDEAKLPILYVTHAPAEVARLATTVVVLQNGRVVRQGSAADVLSDPSVTPAGVRGAGAMLEAVVKAHHEDGLTELNAAGIALFLPRVPQGIGDTIRVRIAASEVILSRDRPEGLSALNILPGTVEAIRAGGGPGAIVSLRTPAGRILARVTRRSAQRLGLTQGISCHAVVKTVSIAPQDVGRA
ncbi:molybdenum ABC transporter ATP-binding protein [Tropicibacter naphthalenivorans]|uniref:Sulfate/thiosulfate import ATP-binding protein CysA n=1 Tax=Tropicibacter naphthalenivorans TaxID=441103 RepID=A0A0P1GC95_9RHOB|nr:molybdenum ABC transporter ATP-binding protein [Tropicibacter naphthalenivorans]CUH79088.1 Sulfate/thiosulfate import ATP-binding protein CysA [Tropicibacter naphthalenivorans]SMD03547.1 molybdate transport system ATP-binding protein [Tropicibacter naphthalenivorans]